MLRRSNVTHVPASPTARDDRKDGRLRNGQPMSGIYNTGGQGIAIGAHNCKHSGQGRENCIPTSLGKVQARCSWWPRPDWWRGGNAVYLSSVTCECAEITYSDVTV